jgi:hypothetical protein
MSADKVVVIPIGAGANGAVGQIQYNDGGQTAGADIYYAKLSGKVGIGETDPSEALDVNGNIKANVFLGDGPTSADKRSLLFCQIKSCLQLTNPSSSSHLK